MTEPTAGGERVGDMIIEAVLRIDDAGNAPLRPLARRTLQVVLRDHRHRQPRINGQRRSQPSQTTAENEHVGETMRHPLRTKCREIAWAFKELSMLTRLHYWPPLPGLELSSCLEPPSCSPLVPCRNALNRSR